MPDGGSSTLRDYKHTFDTLNRERFFKRPVDKGSTVPILNEFVTPHIQSFNSLFDDSGVPTAGGDNRGLLSLGIEDIGEKVVFDGKKSANDGLGNRMSCECFVLASAANVYSYTLQIGLNKSRLQDPWFRRRTGRR
jgi:DNA-directed RNA polymerase I subunit RPA2